MKKTSFRDAVALLSLTVMPFVFFWKLTLAKSTVNLLDQQLIYYPHRKLLGDLFRHGVLPLWNPFAYSGEPLIGQGQFGLLYPNTWLCYFLPAVVALNYSILLNFVVAGTGSYLLARSLTLNPYCSYLAGVTYMFCGAVAGRQIHVDIMATAALLPWVVLAVFRLLEHATPRRYAVAALAISLQLTPGHPQFPAYTGAALMFCALLLSLWRCRPHPRWSSFLPLLQVAGVYSLAVCLCALQLLPWASLASLSVRAAGTPFQFVFAGHMERRQLLLFLFPYLDGGPNSAHLSWEHVFYMGIPALALTAAACFVLFPWLLRRKSDLEFAKLPRAQIAGVLILALVGLVFLITRPYALQKLLYLLPLLGRFRHLARAMPLVAIAIALLAGFGARFVTERNAPGWKTWVRMLAMAVAVLPAAIAASLQTRLGVRIFHLHSDPLSSVFAHRNTLLPALLGLAAGAVLICWTYRPSSSWPRAMMATLVTADMYLFAISFFPTVTPEFYQTPPPAAEFLSRNLGSHRKATFDPVMLDGELKEILFPQWSFVYQFQDVNGYSSVQTRRYTDYLQSRSDTDVSYGLLGNPQFLQPDHPVLGSLDVKYVLVPARIEAPVAPAMKLVFSDPHVRIYENPRLFPRALFTASVRCEQNPARVLEEVTAASFDPSTMAVVEGCRSLPVEDAPSPAPDLVSIKRREFNRIELSSSAARNRFLVLGETYFPGWKALVDGHEVEIYRTNYLFRGIVVPAGTHAIEFRYEPVQVKAGLALSLCSAIFTVWLFTRRSVTG